MLQRDCIAVTKSTEKEAGRCLDEIRDLTDNVHELRSVVQDKLKLYVHSDYDSMPQAVSPPILTDITAPYFIEMSRYLQEIRHSISDINSRIRNSEL